MDVFSISVPILQPKSVLAAVDSTLQPVISLQLLSKESFRVSVVYK